MQYSAAVSTAISAGLGAVALRNRLTSISNGTALTESGDEIYNNLVDGLKTASKVKQDLPEMNIAKLGKLQSDELSAPKAGGVPKVAGSNPIKDTVDKYIGGPTRSLASNLGGGVRNTVNSFLPDDKQIKGPHIPGLPKEIDGNPAKNVMPGSAPRPEYEANRPSVFNRVKNWWSGTPEANTNVTTPVGQLKSGAIPQADINRGSAGNLLRRGMEAPVGSANNITTAAKNMGDNATGSAWWNKPRTLGAGAGLLVGRYIIPKRPRSY